MDNNQKSYTKPAVNNNNDDEIVIRDASGNLKVWQHGRLNDFQEIEEISRKTKESPPQEGLKDSKVLDTGLEGPFLGPLKPTLNNFSSGAGFIKPDEKGLESLYQKKDLPLTRPEETKPIEPKQKKYGINKIVDKVNEVLQLRLNFESKKRLKSILLSYCRHARSLLDSLEVLQRSEENGGMGFKLIASEKLMVVVKNIMERIDQEGGIVIDEEKIAPPSVEATPEVNKPKLKTSPQPPPFSREPDIDIKKEPIKEELPTSPVKQDESKTSTPKDFFHEPTVKLSGEEPIFIKPKLIKKSPAKEDNFPKVARPTSLRTKQITEVKKKPVILGPVEELTSFNLDDFRKMDNNPTARTDKILEKINALAEDSLTKKAEGINAWRQSEVYHNYLKIGEESIRNGISIKQLISDKSAKGEEVLSLEEFETLSDLNQKLRF